MKEVTIRKKCTKCKNGEMLSTGVGFSNPNGVFWEHRCDCCGLIDIERVSYPSTVQQASVRVQETQWS